MPVSELNGAWRIVEAPLRQNQNHGYGFPNSHWLILGDRGVVVRDTAPKPLHFHFRIFTDDDVTPREIRIGGKHGGHGFFDVGEDLLFIGLGISGGRPPRFASDCGYFFAFERDENFELPDVPVWSRSEVYSSELGAIVWHPNANEWRGDVILSDSTRCEIWVSDYLVPIQHFVFKIENVYRWLQDNLAEIKSICCERVEEWIDEDEELSQLGSDDVFATISLASICASNGDIYLWASTSIPIDHSIRIYLDIDDHSIRATGASIEG